MPLITMTMRLVEHTWLYQVAIDGEGGTVTYGDDLTQAEAEELVKALRDCAECVTP